MIRAFITATSVALAALIGLAAAAEGAGSSAAPGVFVKPVEGAALTQGFGCTDLIFEPLDRACPGGHWHSGIDLAAAAGTTVRAAAPGQVKVLHTTGGYGLFVVIDHGNGLSSLYGHLSSVAVMNGDVVGAGDVIGGMGSTGNSTGPHLHFEIRRDGIPEDPRTDMALP